MNRLPQRRQRHRKIQDSATWMYRSTDQPELPPPAVMHPKEFFLGRSTMGTRLAVTYPFPCLHPPGVGLDFLLEIHDRRSTSLGWGACRDRQVRTPPALLPTGMLRSDRGAAQGAGSYSRILGAGFSGRGAAQAAGSRPSHFETEKTSTSQRTRDSGVEKPFHVCRGEDWVIPM